MRPFRVEAPENPVLVVWDGGNGLATHCGLESDDLRKALVEDFERAAVDYLDGYAGRLGRCILRQKWALPLQCAAATETVFLPFPDCRKFAVEQLDAEDVWSAVAGVTVTQMDDHALLEDLPTDQTGLYLTCYAGWETVAEVPENLKQVVRMLVAYWFDNRDAATPNRSAQALPLVVETLIAPLVSVFV